MILKKKPQPLSMCRLFTFAFIGLMEICNVIFSLQNSMFSKGCIQVHVPSAANISTSKTASFYRLRQAAFSALGLCLPFCRLRIIMLVIAEHFKAFYFDVQYRCAVLGHTRDHYKPYQIPALWTFIAHLVDCSGLRV